MSSKPTLLIKKKARPFLHQKCFFFLTTTRLIWECLLPLQKLNLKSKNIFEAKKFAFLSLNLSLAIEKCMGIAKSSRSVWSRKSRRSNAFMKHILYLHGRYPDLARYELECLLGRSADGFSNVSLFEFEDDFPYGDALFVSGGSIKSG